MKPNIILLTLLLSLSTNTSADWWDGWDNANGATPLPKNTAETGNTNLIDWGKGKVDTSSEIDFRISNKGNAHTNRETNMTAGVRRNNTGNTLGYNLAPPQIQGYIPNYGARLNKQKSDGSPLPFPSTNPLFSPSQHAQFPVPHNNNRFRNTPRQRSPRPMRGHYQTPMQYNRPIYRQTPYRLPPPLPFQTPAMQAPYGNSGYGYPNQASPTEQHYLQKTQIINMQHTMETQRQYYNAFIAKMEAQQKEMMRELTQQQTPYNRHHQPEKD